MYFDFFLQDQIRTIKTESQWPFVDEKSSKEKEFDLPPGSSDEDDDLEPNPNRQQIPGLFVCLNGHLQKRLDEHSFWDLASLCRLIKGIKQRWNQR